jgi:hypothetical protein
MLSFEVLGSSFSLPSFGQLEWHLERQDRAWDGSVLIGMGTVSLARHLDFKIVERVAAG